MSAPQRKRLLTASVVAASFSLLLAGCGTTAPEAPAPAADTPAATDGPATADCSPLTGKTISLIVPYNTGGGYDVFARLIAPALGEALDAQIIVENKPGAGGLLGIIGLTNEEPDGTHIAIMNGAGVAASILGEAKGADFSFDDLSYIGRLGAENTIVAGAASGEYQTWEDVQNADGFRFGSTGVGASDYVTPSILIEAFGLNAEIITGFAGQAEAALALLQGNIDGVTGPSDTRRVQIVAGDNIPLLSVTMDPPEDFAAAATYVGELDLTEKQEMLLSSHIKVSELGRPLVAPAGMEPSMLECLREAFDTAAHDDEVLKQATAQNRPIAYIPGEEVETRIVEDIKNVPAEYLTVLRGAYK